MKDETTWEYIKSLVLSTAAPLGLGLLLMLVIVIMCFYNNKAVASKHSPVDTSDDLVIKSASELEAVLPDTHEVDVEEEVSELKRICKITVNTLDGIAFYSYVKSGALFGCTIVQID